LYIKLFLDIKYQKGEREKLYLKNK